MTNREFKEEIKNFIQLLRENELVTKFSLDVELFDYVDERREKILESSEKMKVYEDY